MNPPDRRTRGEQVARMYQVLHAEIDEMCPPGIEEWEPAWEHVAFRDRRLNQIATEYEQGRSSKDEVLAAAQALRQAWREAAEMHRQATTDRAA